MRPFRCAGRRILLSATLATLLLTMLSACGGNAPAQTTPPVKDDSTMAVTTVTEPMEETVLIENGKSAYLVINSRTADAETTAVTRDFISKLEAKTGVKLKLYPDSYTESDCEIIVGTVRNRDAAAARLNEIDYFSWGVKKEGNKFIITAHSGEGVEMALRQFLAHIEEKDGRWVVLGDIEASGAVDKNAPVIPVCQSDNATVAGLYQCGEDSVEVCLRNITKAEYESYAGTLTENGWVKYTENTMASNLFATYTHKDGRTVHLGYYPTLQNGTLRIVNEPTGYLPATTAPAYTRLSDTTFTQIKRKAADINSAPGMSYIMQLADGSFILIDGGPANTDDEDDLLAYLKSLTPAGQKPVIAAWFITHAHSDHMALANNFITKYHNEIEIRMAAYNFPIYEAVQNAKDVNNTASRYQPMIDLFIESIQKYWPQAEHFVIHAGQKLYLADAEIEIFFTHEDLFPLEYSWINHTSTAFRITSGGKTIMILGDCEKSLCQQMADTFGAYLKSDMLQLAHHGANGACMDLYQRIDPAICFWACSQVKFETDERMLGTKEGQEFNAYLRDNTIRVREHYHNSITTVIPITKK